MFGTGNRSGCNYAIDPRLSLSAVIASPSRRGNPYLTLFTRCLCEKALAETDVAILVKHSAQYVLARHLGEDPRDAFTTVDFNLQGLLRPQQAPRGTPPLG